MNSFIHEGILVAAEKTILRPGDEPDTREWMSILREVHRAIGLQCTTWRKRSLRETLARSERLDDPLGTTSPLAHFFLSVLEEHVTEAILAGRFGAALGNTIYTMNMRTFMEYMVFLIDETNFTTPIRLTTLNRDEANMANFNEMKETMGDIDYPDMFNSERCP